MSRQYLAPQGEAVEDYRSISSRTGILHYRKGACMYCCGTLGEAAVTGRWRGSTPSCFKGAPYLRRPTIDECARRRDARAAASDYDLFCAFVDDLKVTGRRPAGVGEGSPISRCRGQGTPAARCRGQGQAQQPIEAGFAARPGSVLLVAMYREWKPPLRSGARGLRQEQAQAAVAGVDPYNFYVDRTATQCQRSRRS